MHSLIYVFDAYCGWCYGFSPALQELSQDPDIEIAVQHGSLFSGTTSAPIGSFRHIPRANARITETTGATFGPDYQDLLAQGELTLDSDAAARGLHALRTVAGPARSLEMAAAMQAAFYRDGLSLSEATTYRTIAETHGLDVEQVSDHLHAPSTAEAARQEQEQLRDLGVHSYPTLLLRRGDQLVQVGDPTASAAQLREQITQATAG